MNYFILLFLSFTACVLSYECIERSYGKERIVCVCNSTFCGSFGFKVPDDVNFIPKGQFKSFTSSKAGQRFEETVGNFIPQAKWESDNLPRLIPLLAALTLMKPPVTINRDIVYQTVVGFGGSFTDATGINLESLSEATRNNILNAYYSDNGLQYSVGRVPIGGADFSTHPYTYDDDQPDDFSLTYFKLQPEDYKYKIPNIQKAFNLTNGQLKLVASPWSAPAWMKTNGYIHRGGFLKGPPGGPYYTTWANYFIKFFDAYKANNITFWAVTPENEPVNGIIPFYPFNSMGYTPDMEKEFITLNLGPTLQNSSHRDMKIIHYDDQRTWMVYYSSKVLSHPEAAKYISGIGFHWYYNAISPPQLQDKIHDQFPDKFLISTEACAGFLELDPSKKVIIGSWDRGAAYAKDIIENLLHWSVGWIDWNMALNATGGPNWAKLSADSTIIANSTSDEFYQNPMFFAMGHFSKFVRPGVKRIDLEIANLPYKVNAVAFEGPDHVTSLVVQNIGSHDRNVTFYDPSNGYLELNIPADSIISLIWKTISV